MNQSEGLVQTTLSKAMAKAVRRVASKEGLSVSAWLRRLIADKLAEDASRLDRIEARLDVLESFARGTSRP